MTILVENTLAGDVGVQVTNARLAATATTGTVTIAASGTRARYDDAQTVHGLPTIRLASGHHRQETPRLRVALPTSGPWSARWYMWLPRLQDAGHGTGEVRSVATLPTHTWVPHATAAGNVGTRLHLPDLAAPAVVWDQETGNAVGIGQWVRVELRYAGGAFESRVYAGHGTDRYRGNIWDSLADPGRTLDLTGYRWRRGRPLLVWGDQGTAVRDLQNELLDLGYNLGPAGADGDFGNATYNAVLAFQQSRGVTPADGEAGPETRAAMDMALGLNPPPLWLSHLAIAEGEWIGPALLPPDEDPPGVLLAGPLPI